MDLIGLCPIHYTRAFLVLKSESRLLAIVGRKKNPSEPCRETQKKNFPPVLRLHQQNCDFGGFSVAREKSCLPLGPFKWKQKDGKAASLNSEWTTAKNRSGNDWNGTSCSPRERGGIRESAEKRWSQGGILDSWGRDRHWIQRHQNVNIKF